MVPVVAERTIQASQPERDFMKAAHPDDTGELVQDPVATTQAEPARPTGPVAAVRQFLGKASKGAGRKLPHICTQADYAQCEAEINQLSATLAQLHTGIEELEARLRNAPTTNDVDARLVADAQHFAQTGEIRQPGGPDALRERHVALRRQRDSVESAIRAKREQQMQLVSQLSADTCRSLVAEHRELASRYVKALLALDALHEEEQALFAALSDAGYRPQFPTTLAWYQIGRLSQRSESSIWNHLRSIEAYAERG
jgi:hypothetical protein